jgi:transposase
VNCRGSIASGHLWIDLLQSIHAVVDNYATHKHPKVRWWLTQHPRWSFHFTPTSASWLNATENFFAKLTNRRLKRGVFRSVDDLKDAINCRIAAPAAFPGSATTDAYWRPSAEGGR